MVRVTVEARESYELVLSLAALCVKRLQVSADLRSDWRSWVKRHLSSELSSALPSLGDWDFPILLNLAMACPSHDAVSYLQWLTDPLTLQMRRDCITAYYEAAGETDCPSLKTIGDVAHLLVLWHAEYFRTLDPGILSGLQRDASEKNHLLPTVTPLDLIGTATHGLTIADDSADKPVTLVPQYHCRPVNVIACSPEGTVIFYSADGLPLWRQDTSVQLRRMAHALSDSVRLEILQFLKSGPKSSADIIKHVGVAKGAMPYHMTMLRAAGLITVPVEEHGTAQIAMREHAADLAREPFAQFFRDGADNRLSS